MHVHINNLFSNIPATEPTEIFQTVLQYNNVKIERIVSTGQTSPVDQWYDQEQAEWVILLSGSARLQFAKNPTVVVLSAGDYVFIPAHEKHRVDWTDPELESIWLAVHIYEDCISHPPG